MKKRRLSSPQTPSKGADVVSKTFEIAVASYFDEPNVDAMISLTEYGAVRKTHDMLLSVGNVEALTDFLKAKRAELVIAARREKAAQEADQKRSEEICARFKKYLRERKKRRAPYSAYLFPSDPPQRSTASLEDAVCCVCLSPESHPEIGDAIVFCDACNVAAHQTCYMIDSLPKGPWYCRSCAVRQRETKRRCMLCPCSGGAYIRLDKKGWVHMICAQSQHLEFVPSSGRMTETRTFYATGYKCKVCGKRGGGQLHCVADGCSTTAHITCAIRAGIYKTQNRDRGQVLCCIKSSPRKRRRR